MWWLMVLFLLLRYSVVAPCKATPSGNGCAIRFFPVTYRISRLGFYPNERLPTTRVLSLCNPEIKTFLSCFSLVAGCCCRHFLLNKTTTHKVGIIIKRQCCHVANGQRVAALAVTPGQRIINKGEHQEQ